MYVAGGSVYTPRVELSVVDQVPDKYPEAGRDPVPFQRGSISSDRFKLRNMRNRIILEEIYC